MTCFLRVTRNEFKTHAIQKYKAIKGGWGRVSTVKIPLMGIIFPMKKQEK
jgi:hypothetical protein